MKICIVEDIDEIRNLYVTFLKQQPEFETVEGFASGELFLNWLASQQYAPDIVLMDIGLPGISGIDCIKLVRKQCPRTEILMLTVYDDSTRIFKSLCAGASGYLLKSSTLDQIKESILTIAQGNASMSPSIARKVIDYFNPPGKEENSGLTQREQQIVLGLCDGLSYKLIADRYGISIHTVRQHIRSIYQKLHVNSKAEVIHLSLKEKN